MRCEVLFTDEFEEWWKALSEDEQDSVAAGVGLLELKGVTLPFPYCSGVHGSRHGAMREWSGRDHDKEIQYVIEPDERGATESHQAKG